jgi:glutamate N-acetyltransferase/amino-acid N-acetyltransferase
MALWVSDEPAVVAAVFTTNQVQAAPVKLCRECLAAGVSRGVVVNSGNANACTGPQGEADAARMAECAAQAGGGQAEEYMVCSTGHIGFPLPMEIIEAGISTLGTELAPGNAANASQGILTTDTHAKSVTAVLDVEGTPVRITGVAKGAGMIEPNMATMLSFLFTDAVVNEQALQDCLSSAVNQSFNRITVDGDQSTNDTVLFFANGAAGNPELTVFAGTWNAFQAAVNAITFKLARMIVRDGEGAKKLVTVRVEGARSNEEADLAARAVANSLLVKTSWAGKYAIWGRIMDSIGYSACYIEEGRVDIDYAEVAAVRGGVGVDVPVETLSAVIARSEFVLKVDLHLGEGVAEVYTCETSRDYVKINEE